MIIEHQFPNNPHLLKEHTPEVLNQGNQILKNILQKQQQQTNKHLNYLNMLRIVSL